MKYVVMTTDEAIEVLKNYKGEKVLVAIQDLENNSGNAIFYPKFKEDCENMIMEAKTISSACDDFVKKLDLFTEKQRDLLNIKPYGLQQTILLRE